MSTPECFACNICNCYIALSIHKLILCHGILLNYVVATSEFVQYCMWLLNCTQQWVAKPNLLQEILHVIAILHWMSIPEFVVCNIAWLLNFTIWLPLNLACAISSTYNAEKCNIILLRVYEQDWSDYDEKAAQAVGIYEVTHQFLKLHWLEEISCVIDERFLKVTCSRHNCSRSPKLLLSNCIIANVIEMTDWLAWRCY